MEDRKNTDVVVVGGGLAGLAAAAYLARSGQSVSRKGAGSSSASVLRSRGLGRLNYEVGGRGVLGVRDLAAL